MSPLHLVTRGFDALLVQREHDLVRVGSLLDVGGVGSRHGPAQSVFPAVFVDPLPHHLRVVAVGAGDVDGAAMAVTAGAAAAAVERVADADSAPVMDRDPGRAGRCVHQGIEDRPVGDRVAAVAHAFRLAEGRRD